LSVNPVPARLLGYSVEEALRMRLQDVIDPQFRAQFDGYLREIERAGESRGLMAVLTRSGERRIWEYHNTLRTEGVDSPAPVWTSPSSGKQPTRYAKPRKSLRRKTLSRAGNQHGTGVW